MYIWSTNISQWSQKYSMEKDSLLNLPEEMNILMQKNKNRPQSYFTTKINWGWIKDFDV